MKISKKSVRYLDIYHALRGKLFSAEYEPGGVIESERKLADAYTTSLITVRKAIGMLADEGLLVKQRGRVTRVSEAVARKLAVLGVFGINVESGRPQRIGTYVSDLLAFSQMEAGKRRLGFDTLWIPVFMPEWAVSYLQESKLREYCGFIFYRCRERNDLLRRVRELNLRHVVITSEEQPFNTVWLDYREAFGLALAAFGAADGRPICVMGLESQFEGVLDVFKKQAHRLRPVILPSGGNVIEYETSGFEKTAELLAAGESFQRVLWLDDVVARGSTRALLQAGRSGRVSRGVVICGRQEIIPLGLPVTYVVHDTGEVVRQAFEMLDRQRCARVLRVPSYRSGYTVLSGEEVSNTKEERGE